MDAMTDDVPRWAAIGERLRWLEQAEWVNGSEIARYLGITGEAWTNYKRGIRLIPAESAIKLRLKYGCSLEWIYMNEESGNTLSFQHKLDEARKAGPLRRKRGRKPRRKTDDS